MRRIRAKDWIRLSAVLLLVGSVLVVELMSGALREFYKERPLQAGVLTGVLLSVVAYFGFDAIRAELTERRWAPLSRLAFMWLASQTTLLIDVVLWLVTGQQPANDARPDEPTNRKLLYIRQQVGIDPPPPIPNLGHVQHTIYRSMLGKLIVDPAWRAFALEQLDRWKWRNRAGVATWAAAMLTTGESADVLNRVALLNEWLSDLQHSLRTDQIGNATTAVPNWFDWHAEAVSLREDLVIAGRGSLPSEWPAFRAALPRTHTDELAARHESNESQEKARAILRQPFRTRGS